VQQANFYGNRSRGVISETIFAANLLTSANLPPPSFLNQLTLTKLNITRTNNTHTKLNNQRKQVSE